MGVFADVYNENLFFGDGHKAADSAVCLPSAKKSPALVSSHRKTNGRLPKYWSNKATCIIQVSAIQMLFYLSGKCQNASFSLLVLKVLKKIARQFCLHSLQTHVLLFSPPPDSTLLHPHTHDSHSTSPIYTSFSALFEPITLLIRRVLKKAYVEQRHFRYPTLPQSIWIFNAFSKFSSQLSRWVIWVCCTPSCSWGSGRWIALVNNLCCCLRLKTNSQKILILFFQMGELNVTQWKAQPVLQLFHHWNSKEILPTSSPHGRTVK